MQDFDKYSNEKCLTLSEARELALEVGKEAYKMAFKEGVLEGTNTEFQRWLEWLGSFHKTRH